VTKLALDLMNQIHRCGKMFLEMMSGGRKVGAVFACRKLNHRRR
jgi:hypothetical protein